MEGETEVEGKRGKIFFLVDISEREREGGRGRDK